MTWPSGNGKSRRVRARGNMHGYMCFSSLSRSLSRALSHPTSCTHSAKAKGAPAVKKRKKQNTPSAKTKASGTPQEYPSGMKECPQCKVYVFVLVCSCACSMYLFACLPISVSVSVGLSVCRSVFFYVCMFVCVGVYESVLA